MIRDQVIDLTRYANIFEQALLISKVFISVVNLLDLCFLKIKLIPKAFHFTFAILA